MNIVLMERFEEYRDWIKKIGKKMGNIEVLCYIIQEPIQWEEANNGADRFKEEEEEQW